MYSSLRILNRTLGRTCILSLTASALGDGALNEMRRTMGNCGTEKRGLSAASAAAAALDIDKHDADATRGDCAMLVGSRISAKRSSELSLPRRERRASSTAWRDERAVLLPSSDDRLGVKPADEPLDCSARSASRQGVSPSWRSTSPGESPSRSACGVPGVPSSPLQRIGGGVLGGSSWVNPTDGERRSNGDGGRRRPPRTRCSLGGPGDSACESHKRFPKGDCGDGQPESRFSLPAMGKRAESQ